MTDEAPLEGEGPKSDPPEIPTDRIGSLQIHPRFLEGLGGV